ncbi:MAG: hypothetical protein H6R40_936, partial [Gemmatimonadetes bacterium]|nr:hypothetical protein [Gemmatimonadota bacterium]
MRSWRWAVFLAGAVACSDNTAPEGTIILEADFNQAAGWTADFVDVPASQEPDVQFDAGTRTLPDNLGAGQQGLYHAGTNISDDLFMFFRKQVSGLEPGTAYQATFELTFASTAGAGCDVGPSSIWIKAGLSPQVPARTVDGSGNLRLTVDKGQQASDGATALNLGDIRNAVPGCPSGGTWGGKTLTSGGRSLTVTTTSDGKLWLYFGSESGFEIRHELYFLHLKATLTPR